MSDERKILNREAYGFAVTVFALGIIALFLSAHEGRWASEAARVVIREVGALFVVTAVLSVFWELLAKRAVQDEVLSRVGISRSIHDSGLLSITDDFHRRLDWEDLFRNARDLDIFFAYGRSWFAAHGTKLHELSGRGGTIRVVLPDRDDDAIVGELARRFSITNEELIDRIDETVAAFKELGQTATARVSVWFLPRPPVFSYYRFDHRGLVATYHHRDTKWHVPALTFERDGSLFDYFEGEFDAMISGTNPPARLVYKNR